MKAVLPRVQNALGLSPAKESPFAQRLRILENAVAMTQRRLESHGEKLRLAQGDLERLKRRMAELTGTVAPADEVLPPAPGRWGWAGFLPYPMLAALGFWLGLKSW